MASSPSAACERDPTSGVPAAVGGGAQVIATIHAFLPGGRIEHVGP
jgi:hypothetical protein